MNPAALIHVCMQLCVQILSDIIPFVNETLYTAVIGRDMHIDTHISPIENDFYDTLSLQTVWLASLASSR